MRRRRRRRRKLNYQIQFFLHLDCASRWCQCTTGLDGERFCRSDCCDSCSILFEKKTRTTFLPIGLREKVHPFCLSRDREWLSIFIRATRPSCPAKVPPTSCWQTNYHTIAVLIYPVVLDTLALRSLYIAVHPFTIISTILCRHPTLVTITAIPSTAMPQIYWQSMERRSNTNQSALTSIHFKSKLGHCLTTNPGSRRVFHRNIHRLKFHPTDWLNNKVRSIRLGGGNPPIKRANVWVARQRLNISQLASRRQSRWWRRDGRRPTPANADGWTVWTTRSKNYAKLYLRWAAIVNCPNSKHSKWRRPTSMPSTNSSNLTEKTIQTFSNLFYAPKCFYHYEFNCCFYTRCFCCCF